MTLPPLERYAGREQAYVKHHFLATYIERLLHKVAGSFDEIVYVDGFSGPWQSADEDFSDTSFGIALNALRTAKASWKGLGRQVSMSAVLVEKRPPAFATLQTLQPKYPDVRIDSLNGDFRELIGLIGQAIPKRAFAFILIDPKGWRIPMTALAPLLARSITEVLFNFMFDFINRAASMRATVTVEGLNELLPIGGWREALADVDANVLEPDRPNARKQILISAFRQVLGNLGNYPFVADVPVLRPLKDRTLYSLVYATRNDAGIEVFRDCQIKTLDAQDTVRSGAKIAAVQAQTGQSDMFATVQGLGPDLTAEYLKGERNKAEDLLIALVRSEPLVTWAKLWPQILARHAIRRPELNAIAARLRQDGQLVFPDWEPGKRVPQPHYRLSAPD